MTRFLILCSLFGTIATVAGCGSQSSPPAPAVSADASEDDLQEIGSALEAVATLRRDGDQSIIEVDLRDGDVMSVSEQLARLPKLRSLLLSGSNLSDAGLKDIGQIDTLESLDLRGCAISDAGVAELAGLTKLKAIKFSGKGGQTRVGDASMRTLGQLDSLKVIAVDFLPVTDDGVAGLAGLESLAELYLAGTAVTNRCGESLRQFPSLLKLRIASTAFGSEGLAMIANQTAMTELDLSDCEGIDAQALETLARLTELSKLNLYNTSVGDADWTKLKPLSKLTWLNVDKTNVSDQSLKAIGELSELRFLHLGSTRITDAGLEHLSGCSQLETLIVTRTAVTQAGVDRLQTQLPETEIQLEYEP